MSYDIHLYERAFLRKALVEGLGDWTKAPPLPETARVELVRSRSKPASCPRHPIQNSLRLPNPKVIRLASNTYLMLLASMPS